MNPFAALLPLMSTPTTPSAHLEVLMVIVAIGVCAALVVCMCSVAIIRKRSRSHD